MKKNNYIDSFKDLLKNPILFVPDLITILFTVIGAYIVVLVSGLGFSFTNFNYAILTDKLALEPLIVQLRNHIQTNLGKLITSLLIFFITAFIVGAGMIAVKFNLITSIIHNKKPKFKNLLDLKSKHFYNVILLRILTFLSFLALIFVFLIISALFYTIHPYLSYIPIPLILIFYWIIYFRYPIMFLNNKNAFNSLTSSYNYFRNKPKEVITIWLITTLTLIGFQLIFDQLLRLISILVLIIPLITLFLNISMTIYRFRSLKS